MSYVPLHVHTEYSLLDGSNKIPEYVARAKELGMTAAAITDHGVMFGCVDFYKACKDAGIKPNQSIVYKETIVRDRGYENAKKALKAGCDAIWSSGAFSALCAIQFLKDQGIKMPEDFGVAATANESFTSLITPSLTTVDQHPKTMGKLAAEAMLRLLDNKTEGELLTVPTDLIIRDSSSRK